MEALTIDQLSLLKDVYYNKKLFFGRDKLYKYLRDNHEDASISRRQLDKWLKSQATHMIHQRSKSIQLLLHHLVQHFLLRRPDQFRQYLLFCSSVFRFNHK